MPKFRVIHVLHRPWYALDASGVRAIVGVAWEEGDQTIAVMPHVPAGLDGNPLIPEQVNPVTGQLEPVFGFTDEDVQLEFVQAVRAGFWYHRAN